VLGETPDAEAMRCRRRYGGIRAMHFVATWPTRLGPRAGVTHSDMVSMDCPGTAELIWGHVGATGHNPAWRRDFRSRAE